uniref:DUF1275 family protein n=1 Tax=Pseudonocardia pini TaxID=2758030 RepID=UPI0015EFE2DC
MERRTAAMLVATVVTGMVDVVSFLAMDHVFVANITGNLVFLGVAVTGGPFPPQAPLAVGGFLVG